MASPGCVPKQDLPPASSPGEPTWLRSQLATPSTCTQVSTSSGFRSPPSLVARCRKGRLTNGDSGVRRRCGSVCQSQRFLTSESGSGASSAAACGAGGPSTIPSDPTASPRLRGTDEEFALLGRARLFPGQHLGSRGSQVPWRLPQARAKGLGVDRRLISPQAASRTHPRSRAAPQPRPRRGGAPGSFLSDPRPRRREGLRFPLQVRSTVSGNLLRRFPHGNPCLGLGPREQPCAGDSRGNAAGRRGGVSRASSQAPPRTDSAERWAWGRLKPRGPAG